jgi:hypothetical protein
VEVIGGVEVGFLSKENGKESVTKLVVSVGII